MPTLPKPPDTFVEFITRFPDLGLVLYLDDLDAILYVDTSGEALFKRGWREDTGEAPLKETLAAAMLAAADWQGRPEDGALLDPCCGAGTIPIEAGRTSSKDTGEFTSTRPGWRKPPMVPVISGPPCARLWSSWRRASRCGTSPSPTKRGRRCSTT